jgi:hypothetical protein
VTTRLSETRARACRRFFSCFIAALQKLGGRLRHDIGGALRSGQLPTGEVILAALAAFTAYGSIIALAHAGSSF